MGKFKKDFNTFVNDKHKYECDGKFFDTKQQKAAYVKNKKSHEDAERRKEEDEKTRSPREFVCKSCGNSFTKDMTDKEFSNQKNYPKYCSRYCANRRVLSEETKRKISTSLSRSPHPGERRRFCIVCGNEFWTKSGGRKTCSDDCKDFYRTHRKSFLSDETISKLSAAGLKSCNIQMEKRRSENEIYFCKLCEDSFNKVTHNENKFNGWDADVLIYDYKVAVLWNGNWHYIEIKKDSPLEKIQERDKKKIKEIEKMGWIPYIIEDRGKYNKTFVENEFQKFMDFIQTFK